MIISYASEYLSPTKIFRRLSLLHAMHDRPNSSQHAIGKITHLSSSMVNNYIKSFKTENLLTVSGSTNRTQSYHLTDAGKNALRQSLLSYSTEIVQMYGAVKREIAGILRSYYTENIRTVVLFGAAETAEVVYTAIKETELAVIGVVDSDTGKQGGSFNGFMIKPPGAIRDIRPDAVIITSFAHQEEMYASIQQIAGQDIAVKKLSDIVE